MRLAIFSRTFFLASAFLFSVLTVMGQDDSAALLKGSWTKSANGGTVTITFLPDYKWEVNFTGKEEPDVYGKYVISGTQITFTDEGGDYSSDSSGSYEFEVDDSSLQFTKVDDPVNGRSMLVAGSWTKAGETEK
jgi:hypothetical protein